MISFLLTLLGVGALVLLCVFLVLLSAIRSARKGGAVDAPSEYLEPRRVHHEFDAIDECVPRDSSGRPFIPM